MHVTLFHLMPYAYLDMAEREKYRSAWVILPNTLFDPDKGHELYNRYLDELEMGEQYGFDAIAVNEHHQNAYGLMPSPVVMAATLTRKTKRVQIAVLGSAFGLREHPLTLAEEHAMMDCITGGRLISGMVRGIGAEYYSFPANPAISHERFHEAHDLVIQAWTRPGPFSFEGKHYHFEYVNLWPRPYQKPHPAIWIPSQGSTETVDWSSHPSRRYVYLQTYSPIKAVAKYLNMYREIANKKHGYTAKSSQLGWATPLYVAETDEKAIEDARRPIELFFSKFLAQPPEMLFPPGYLSMASLKGVTQAKQTLRGGTPLTIEKLIAEGVVIIGSVETVKKRLTEAHRLTGFQNFVTMLQFATLDRDKTKRSTELFVEKVLPHVRSLDDDNFVGLAAAAE
ncbi:MAG: LLM class flavin-dependent oxidoreductase [Alphaproteobacteria bacterium]|nr:LLM class flavin-dependent oxidoreductase [Alphaproteobacteria bacterium]